MRGRSCLKALLLAGIFFPLAGCGNTGLDSIQVTPATASLVVGGATLQLTATGTYGNAAHPSTQNVTNTVTWTSAITGVASVSSSGVVTAVGAGSTTITATAKGFSGAVSASSVVTVTLSSASTAEPLLSIVVLPSSTTVNNLLGTGQFLAYGTFSTAPTLMDITNGITHPGFTGTVPVTWISSAPTIFPINSSGAPGATAGLVTADGSGTADIYAVAANPDGTLVYSPMATFNCPLVLPTITNGVVTNPGSCNEDTIASGLLVTLTVFNAGLNTTNWLVTAPSATGTPDVIHCGPGWTLNGGSGGSVCMATYPLGTTVTLTAPAQTGVAFGGWSFNCAATGTVTATGPNSCTVQLGTDNSSNVSVGAIFN